MTNVVVTAAKRTPIGGFHGELSSLAAPQLGAAAISAAIEESGFSSSQVDELHMGCVLQAGVGQAPARQAGLGAKIPESVPCTTINKMCGSGMQAVLVSHDRIALGRCQVVVAGGMESMSNAPYLLQKMRFGCRVGHSEIHDHMFLDGLEDAYEKGRLMGTFAEECAADYRFSRREQDDFALESLRRARESHEVGGFDAEIHPILVQHRSATSRISDDEQPRIAKPNRIPHLKPAFKHEGSVTAANSSSISDGAAALVLTSEKLAQQNGAAILAHVVGQSTIATKPSKFTIAPTLAVKQLLENLSWKPNQVDLWEVNEAFAVVSMAFMRDLGVSHDCLNIRGGACALGHPIGASGARILVTLAHAMRETESRRGVAAICIGGGEATAVALERH